MTFKKLSVLGVNVQSSVPTTLCSRKSIITYTSLEVEARYQYTAIVSNTNGTAGPASDLATAKTSASCKFKICLDLNVVFSCTLTIPRTP